VSSARAVTVRSVEAWCVAPDCRVLLVGGTRIALGGRVEDEGSSDDRDEVVRARPRVDVEDDLDNRGAPGADLHARHRKDSAVEGELLGQEGV